MALPQKQNYDALAIIDAIDQASSKELSLLKDIHRAVAAHTVNQPSPTKKLEASNRAILNAIMGRKKSGNDDYLSDYRNLLNELGNDLNDKRINLNDKRNHLPRMERLNRTKELYKSDENQSYSSESVIRKIPGGGENGKVIANGNQINDKSIQLADNIKAHEGFAANYESENQLENISNTLKIIQKNDENSQKNDFKKRLQQGKKKRLKDSSSGPQRDANGRFLSKKKNDDDQAHRDNEDSKSLFKRLTSAFSGRGKSDGNLQDAAGTAAGGVVWSAGKEPYDLGGGVKDKVVSLNDWNKKRKEGKADKVSETPIRFPDVTPNRAQLTPVAKRPLAQGSTQSQQAFQSSKNGNVISILRDQNKTLVENDRTIIEELKEIEENTRNGGKTSGGGAIGKLLGKLGAGAIGKLIGKRILSGLASALGGKAIYNLLKGLLGGGKDSTSLPDGGLRTKKPGEKKPSKTKEPKVKVKPKAAGKVGKVATVAGAAVAATVAGAKSIFGGKDTPEDVEKAKQKVDAEEGKAKEKVTPATETKGKTKTMPGTVSEPVLAPEVKPASKIEGEAAEKAAGKTEKAAAETAAGKAEKATAEKAAEKAGGKVLSKAALRAVPILGTAISAGMDAASGYTDTEGQKAAFNIGDGQEVSTRQKSEFSAANVLNMGGLISGGAGLLASGARAIGMDKTADALTFDTSDIAKSLDSGVDSAKDFFTTGSDNQISAIKEGTKQTTAAIEKLETTVSGVGGSTAAGSAGAVPGAAVSVADAVAGGLGAPTTNDVSDDLNIGGKNAKARNFRNNNFGNIRYVGQSDATREAMNAKGEQAFAKYDSPEEGMRGLANQLSSYANGTSKAVNYQKLTNVRDIISNFAPAGENDTEGYIATLSKSLGVKDNQTLDMNNPEVMTKMIRQISTIEGGNPQVTDQYIKNAIGTRQGNKWEGQFNPETLAKINAKRTASGLKELSSTDQRANPERYTVGAKIVDGAKELGGKALELGKKGVDGVSNFTEEQMSKFLGNVEGLRIRAPDKGLTMPAGDKLPPGLASAAKISPAKSATIKASMLDSSLQVPKSILGPLDQQPVKSQQNATVLSGGVIPLSEVNKQHLVTANGAPLQPANTAIKEADTTPSEDKGWFSSTVDTLKSVGGKGLDMATQIGKGTLTNLGVNADHPMDWAADKASSGVSGLVSNVTGGLLQNTPLSFLGDTVSSALSNKSGQLTKEAFNSFATNPPPPVIDLAGSGIAPVTQRDKESRGSDEEGNKLLTRIAKAVERDPVDKPSRDANPNKTTETAQPAPRKDVPLSISDSTLEKLFS